MNLLRDTVFKILSEPFINVYQKHQIYQKVYRLIKVYQNY